MPAGRPPFVDVVPSAVLVKQATAPPPPLPGLRQDVPRPLAHAIHKLLAKRPEDRPDNAMVARTLLERSLTRPEYVQPELEPLASTVKSVSSRHNIAFRAIAPALVIAVLGTALLVWAGDVLSTGQPQTADAKLPLASALGSASTVGSQDFASRSAGTPRLPPPTVETARRIVDSVASGSIGDVSVVRKGRGVAIA